MDLTSNGRIIGEVKKVDTGVPGVLPVIVFIITDEEIRRDVCAKIDAEEPVDI
jgi:hypothetical protein